MATKAVAVFQIQDGRGKTQAQHLLGAEGGQTVTDRYAAYHCCPTRITRSDGRIWRKACFGTDSPDGSRFTERILTLVASLRLQGRARSTLDTFAAAYFAQLRGTAHPSLLPVLAATR